MISVTLSRVLIITLGLIAFVSASCKSNEALGPSDPNDTSNRVSSFTPPIPADLSKYATPDLKITTYNIQSGLSDGCVQNIDAQVKQLVEAHYFGTQEVDVNSIHCECNQPAREANATGKTVKYLRTIYNQGGEYGHSQGSVYTYTDTKYYLYKTFTSEVRGILATSSQPPQLGGRVLWLLGTHLQYDSVSTRQAQATELVNYAKAIEASDPKALIIVVGDMYCQFGDPDYAELTDYFVDTWVQFSGSQSGGATVPSSNPTVRDDLVLYRVPSGFQVNIASHAQICTDESDHCRVAVDFRFSGLSNVTIPTSAPTSGSTGTPTSAPTSGTGSGSSGSPTSTPTSGSGSGSSGSPTSTPTPAPTTPTCSAALSLIKRNGGAFTQDGKQLSVYDINIVNKGSCLITSARTTSTIPSLVQSWNYQPSTGAIDIFGGISPSTVYSSAGFIASSSFAYDTSAFTYACSTQCTSVPPATSNCSIAVEATARTSGGSWTAGGLDYQIFDLSVSNFGSKPATNIMFYIEFPSGDNITQQWNLDTVMASSTKRLVTFNLFGQSLAPEASYSKTAGLIVSGPSVLNVGQVKITLVSAHCGATTSV